MAGALVIVVGVVLTAVGLTLGTFKPLPGYDSPIPLWLGWSAAVLGAFTIIGGIFKAYQEAKHALVDRRIRARALRQQRRQVP